VCNERVNGWNSIHYNLDRKFCSYKQCTWWHCTYFTVIFSVHYRPQGTIWDIYLNIAVYQIVPWGSQNCEKQQLPSSYVCSFVVWIISAVTSPIFMKFGIWEFFENLWRKFEIHWNLTRLKGTLHEYVCRLLITSPWIPHTMRNVSDKSCRENRNTRLIFSNFFRKSSCLWKNVGRGSGRARHATMTTHAHCMLDN
jgi:hypothetical protein